MSELVDALFRWGVIASLSDREAFIEKVSGVFEQWQNDPEQSKKLARLLMAYLEDQKENLNAKRMVKKFAAEDLATKEDIEELRALLEKLSKTVQQINRKPHV